VRSRAVSVYAVTNSRTVPDAPGLRPVRVGNLTALVASARRAPAPTAANLRRYHETIAAIAAVLPAVLPVRFATIMTEPELVLVLRARAKSLTETLRRVRGGVQMTLRLAGVPQQDAAAVRPPGGRARSGMDYLQQRAAREREVPGFEAVRSVLGAWIVEERVERKGEVVSVYHLIRRTAAPAYRRAATAALVRAGLRGVVSGPFPPYAFSAL
jgi:Gas vesicle synthesis protein GvpL/GvpF